MSVNNQHSADFSVDTGVRQGAIASPVLFNFAIDWVMRQVVDSSSSSGRKVGISTGDKLITDLDYADDIALLADNETDLQFFVDQVVLFGAMLGLKINPDKTKMMAVNTPGIPKVTVQGVDVEVVESFHYLGSLISIYNSCEADVLFRTCLAQGSFQQLYPHLFSRDDVSVSTKMRVYLASVRTILLYGCESWTVTSSLSSTLDSCEMGFLRRLLSIRNFPYPPNTDVRNRCDICS